MCAQSGTMGKGGGRHLRGDDKPCCIACFFLPSLTHSNTSTHIPRRTTKRVHRIQFAKIVIQHLVQGSFSKNSPHDMCICCQAEERWLDQYGDPVRPRKHGFEWPPDLLQLVAWLVILILFADFCFLHMWMYVPIRNGAPAFAVVVAILGLSGIITIVLKIVISASDHSVEGILDGSERLSDLALAETPPEGMKPCSYCRIFVPVNARHCSTCDKCTPNFDHHCRWLNACIGERNYKLFFAFMVSSWISIFFTFVSAVYLLAAWLPNFDAIGDRLKEVYRNEGGGVRGYDVDGVYNGNPAHPGRPSFDRGVIPGERNTGLGVMWMVLVLAGALLALLGLAGLAHLLRYHIRLIRDGETTYERIKRRRDEKRSRGTYVRKQDGCCGVSKRRVYNVPAAGAATAANANDPSAAADGVATYTSTYKGRSSAFAVEMVAVEPNHGDGSDTSTVSSAPDRLHEPYGASH